MVDVPFISPARLSVSGHRQRLVKAGVKAAGSLMMLHVQALLLVLLLDTWLFYIYLFSLNRHSAT